jgi:hypothetical protein
MKTFKVETNFGQIGFAAGFLGFSLWSFFGNISSTNNMRMSLFDYLCKPIEPALIESGGLEAQDVFVSLILIALVVGLIVRFIFSLIAGTKTIVIPDKKDKASTVDHNVATNL